MNFGLFLVFMLPATLFLGLHDVLTKKILSRNINEQVLLIANFIITGILALSLVFIFGNPELKPGFWTALLATMVLNIFGQWCWYKAFQLGDVSLVSPLRLITPPLVVLTGILILGEMPSSRGMVGIVVMVIGLWFLLNKKSSRDNQPPSPSRRRAILLAVAGALLFACSFPFDKKAVVASSSLVFVGIVFPLIALGNLLIYLIYNKRWPDFSSLRRVGWLLPLAFVVHTAGIILAAHSLSFALAAYASAIKRLLSFWAVLLSGAILREQIGQRLLATIIMLAGVLIIILAG